jgi:hypothetical protein
MDQLVYTTLQTKWYKVWGKILPTRPGGTSKSFLPRRWQTRWSGPRHPGEASALVEIVELDWPAGILLVHDAVTLGPAFCLPAPTFPTRLAARPGTACIRGTDEALPVANRQYLRDGSESVVAYWV